ncbi:TRICHOTHECENE 3-O-ACETYLTRANSFERASE [Salix purpurea]|uniref:TRICHOTHECENE 3-O-ACETYLTRANSFERASE n=1 Tax=Salix purpurea TaxID=77065 RepID=A0A9Q0UKA6_SALPP|nr:TRICHOTHECENE 3-O-ACETYLTRANSFERASE [Salix purpurea]
MKITIKESSMVTPIQDTPNRRLEVTNLDLFHAKYHVPVLILYRPNGSANFFEVEVLKEALSKVLVSFYPVAGRLARDANGRVEINCNGEGVLFVEAETDSAMDDFVDLKRSDELPQLIPTVDYSDISSYPLLVLQVTRFRCGGVCLGVGWHHILADGTGCLYFINTWSDVARGLPIKTPPYFDRAILRGRVPPSLTFHHVEYDPFPTINTRSQNPIPMSGSRDISVANLKITSDLLSTLKAMAKNDAGKTEYSTYVILTAHIWRCVCKARGLSDDQLTKLNIATNGRKRFRPPIPPGYFGNVIFSTSPIALYGGLLSESLVHTAERIHRAIKRMDDEYLRSAVDYLENLGEPTAVMRNSETYRSPNLSIVNWVNLPFYDADFRWGKPAYIRPAFAYQGKGYILPSSSGDGTLSLTICLETDHLKSFQKLFYEPPKRSCL